MCVCVCYSSCQQFATTTTTIRNGDNHYKNRMLLDNNDNNNNVAASNLQQVLHASATAANIDPFVVALAGNLRSLSSCHQQDRFASTLSLPQCRACPLPLPSPPLPFAATDRAQNLARTELANSELRHMHIHTSKY